MKTRKLGWLIAGSYTPDVQAPTMPTNLTGSLITIAKEGRKPASVSVNLKWSASTDNVGVTG